MLESMARRGNGGCPEGGTAAGAGDVALAAALIEDLLSSGLDARIEVTGASMRPLLRGGEIVTVERADPESLAPGELVLCRSGAGRLVLHRLVRVRGAGAQRRWWTRGDALMACDEPFAAGRVLGRVTRIEGLRLSLTPGAVQTRVLRWRAASRAFGAAASVGRLARRLSGRLGRARIFLTFPGVSRKVRRPL